MPDRNYKTFTSSFSLSDNEDNPEEKDRRELELALSKLGNPGCFLYVVFILCSVTGVFNIWHLTSYVFQGYNVDYWCRVQEMESTNWTSEDIRAVSNPSENVSSCTRYKYNYTSLAEMSYEEAMRNTILNPEKPGLEPCKAFNYSDYYTISSEWNLVCDRIALKSTAQMIVSFGKFLGGLVFGFIADRWGRHMSITISCVMYIVAGPLAGILPYYWMFILVRLVLGMAGSGCYTCCFTLLTEVCNSSHRAVVGIVYNMSYPVGLILLPVIAYYLPQWQHLQLAISIPAVILILSIWFLPESPRWLISQGRYEDAWKIVRKARPDLAVNHVIAPQEATNPRQPPAEGDTPSHKVPWFKQMVPSPRILVELFKDLDTTARLIICYCSWFVSALTYYALSLNADNFSTDRYIYSAVSGAVEAAGYLLPIPILRFVGRRTTTCMLFLGSGVSLLLVMVVTERMAVAMVGRLCIGAVYSVVILYTSELFPTVIRNSAVSTSSTMSHVGAMAAPYIVDILGAQAWYIPSTICAILAIFAALLCLLLPETKGKNLSDSAVAAKTDSKYNDHVSFKNMLCFKM